MAASDFERPVQNGQQRLMSRSAIVRTSALSILLLLGPFATALKFYLSRSIFAVVREELRLRKSFRPVVVQQSRTVIPEMDLEGQ